MPTRRILRRSTLTCLALLLLPGLVAPSATSAAQEASPPEEARRLEIDDYFAIDRLGEPRISPEGDQVAYTVTVEELAKNRSRSRIWMTGIDGDAPIPMTLESTSASRPRWSPDGRYLSFLSARRDEATQVWALNRRGGEAIRLTDVEQGVDAYEWSPDGKRLVLVMEDPDPDTDDDEADDGNGDDADVPDPWVVDRLQIKRDYEGYLDHRRSHLYVFDLETEELRQITSGDYDDSSPAWAPDGGAIAFVSNRTAEPDASYDTDIWLVHPDSDDPGAELVRVTRSAAADSAPAFSPDGERIAYLTSLRAESAFYGQNEVAVIGLEPGAERQVLTAELDRNPMDVGFTPTGDSVWFLLEDQGERQLATVPAGGGEVQRWISGPRSVGAVDLGTDGTVVALISDPGMPGNLFAAGDDGELRQITRHNDELLAGIRLGTVDKVRYPSDDGYVAETFVVKPPGFEEGARYPTILWPHGGPQAQDDWRFNFRAQLFAAHGYVVLMPNYRGSTGYGQDHILAIWRAWGTVDLADSLAAMDWALEAGIADPDRQFLGGWSYGGILTSYGITSTDRFRAAISVAGGGLWIASYGHDHYQRWWTTELGLPWEDREIYERLSAFNRVDQVTTPTLWMCGEDDWNVPVLHSEQMYQAMRHLGVETELVVYPGQHHGIDSPVYTKDLFERWLEWYAAHGGTPVTATPDAGDAG